MKTVLVLFIALAVLSGCNLQRNTTVYHNMTFVTFEKLDDNHFLNAVFKDENKKYDTFVIHKLYKTKLKKGHIYDFKLRKHKMFRPNNEIISVDLYGNEYKS